MTFTDTLWSETAELQEAIRTMPFNAELAAGTLPAETFRGYVVQDAHYLEGFARALALAASRAPDPETVARLAGSAAGAIAVERQLHAHYMALYGVGPEDFAATPPSRSCDHYVGFLIRSAATAPFPVAVAALLPCFWIYHRVGLSIHGNPPRGAAVRRLERGLRRRSSSRAGARRAASGACRRCGPARRRARPGGRRRSASRLR